MSERQIDWYPPGPQARGFMRSAAFICGIMGPIGSGKSTTAIAKLSKNASMQTRGADGVARRRTAIIRNTYPELATTTIKSWHQWWPPESGDWRDKGPPRHMIRRYDSDRNLIFEWEVLFVALDKPSDVAKVLSMELSDAWINEAREVPKAVMDGLTGRVGRFPQTVKDRHGKVLHGCVNPQLLMDTNPPDTDHWWYVLAEQDVSSEYGRQMLESMREAEEKLRELGLLAPDQPLVSFFHQPGANDPGAENLQNLDPAYYIRAKAAKDQDWIKVYIDGCYGFVKDGKPLYPEYRDNIHAREFGYIKGLPIWVGVDFGLTPAATFRQRLANGRWLVHSELTTEHFGIIRFADLLKATISERYGDALIGAITGDPSGSAAQAGAENEENLFQLAKARGVEMKPAETNDPNIRREAIAEQLKRLVDGEPGMLVHAVNCPILRKGYQGGYSLRRVEVAGQERYRDKPDKNKYSHVCEADQYNVLGAGEGRLIVKRDRSIARALGDNSAGRGPRFAITD